MSFNSRSTRHDRSRPRSRPRCVRCHGWVQFEDDLVAREWACLNCGYRGRQVLIDVPVRS